ncbi:hypothetical protein, partial [Desulfovibrio piger]|uniref:hypothetical protein n=1 Tax=Desulfovibrio piger TaxID=901 RepID=UPI0037356005
LNRNTGSFLNGEKRRIGGGPPAGSMLQVDGSDGVCCEKRRAARFLVREQGRIRGIFPLAQADEAKEKSYAVPKLQEQNVR